VESSEVRFDISELARLGGVSPRTLRYWGERGLLRPVGRGPGGRRAFGPEALERIRFIGRLKRLGLTLRQIAELNEAFERGRTPKMLDHLEALLDQRLAEIAERLAELRRLEDDLRAYRDHIRSRNARNPQP